MTASLPLQPRWRLASAFVNPQTWRELAHHLFALLLAPFGLAYAVATIAVGAGTAVTVVGLLLTATLVLGARGWGALHRELARELLAEPVEAPPAPRQRSGAVGYAVSGLSDAPGWRALAHMVLSFVVSLTGSVLAIVLFVAGWGCVAYPVWRRYLPEQTGSDGEQHRGASFGTSYFLDTAPRIAAAVAVGLLVVFVVWPAVNHGVARLHAYLARLLGPTAAERRVERLAASRLRSVESADDRLRRIERDLHDGAQAQLAAVAMKLGDAADRLRRGDDSADVAALLDSARGVTTGAIADVRRLALGIHPAALDTGLETALETLVSSLSLPVALRVDVAPRPPRAIESMAYFCTAELLANAVKHSGARRLAVGVTGDGTGLRVAVSDDGHGGARVVAGGGLEGLTDRIASVDGVLDLESPEGGPTTAVVTLPYAGRA